MCAGQRARLTQTQNRLRVAVDGVPEQAIVSEHAAADPTLPGDYQNPMASLLAEGRAQASAICVVDADHRGRTWPRAREDPSLGGDVAIHAAVAAEVIGRDVEQHSDIKH
jgi:hypothetical protein